MGIFNLFKPKDDRAFEFSAAAAQQDLANPANTQNSQEYVDTLGKIGYLLDSPTMQEFIMTNPYMRLLAPAFQAVIRTTNTNRFQAELMQMDYQILFCMAKLTMPPHVYEQGAMTLLQSLEVYSNSIVFDTIEGWKGHLCTENVRKIEVGLNQRKKLFGK